MKTIVALSGSLRSGSYNTALLRALATLAPDGVTIDLASIRGIPVYDGDVEKESGVPEVVTALKDRVASADGVLIASPEYNNSIPGPLKNAIDWMSRPPKDIARVFGGRHVALIGASAGRGGTRLAQAAWLPVFRVLGMRPWFEGSLYLANASESFDASGALTDKKIEELLSKFVAGFAASLA